MKLSDQHALLRSYSIWTEENLVDLQTSQGLGVKTVFRNLFEECHTAVDHQEIRGNKQYSLTAPVQKVLIVWGRGAHQLFLEE